MQRRGTVPIRARASAALGVLLMFLAQCSIPCRAECSTKCIAEQCDTLGIRYGKYCGVGHTGCPGQMPCDDLDACCQDHDQCVDKFGLTNVECHNKLKKCLTRVHKSGKVGFSKLCPIETAAPTMIRGMDYAILLSLLDRSDDL